MANRQGILLRSARIAAGVAVWAVATWMLVSYGMSAPRLASWIEQVQFMPAAMAFALSTIVLWLIITLVLGRIYCSVACPLGVFQDACSRAVRLTRRARRRRSYHYSRPLSWCRNISLACVMVSILLGISVVTVLTDPWSIYSRACADIVKPLWGMAVNQLAEPPVMIAAASTIGIIVAGFTIVLIGAVAMRNGRTFCNTLCPVGTTLGYVSRYSVMHIDINTDKCTQCRRCEHVCKASCIDLTSHVVDSSRCVDCFDCLTVCDDDAIRYTWERYQLSTPMMMKTQPPLAGTRCMTRTVTMSRPVTRKLPPKPHNP